MKRLASAVLWYDIGRHETSFNATGISGWFSITILATRGPGKPVALQIQVFWNKISKSDLITLSDHIGVNKVNKRKNPASKFIIKNILT